MARALDELIEAFTSLPGIGKKSAARLAFHLLKRPVEEAQEFADRIINARRMLRGCSVCGNLAEKDLCDICADSSRVKSLVCVVEESSDVSAIESTGEYRGCYHVLGGVLSPLDGIGPENLNIDSLKKRLSESIPAGKDGVSEIIIATNPSTEGEATASYLQSVLKGKGLKMTRIARGLPAGSSLEFADKVTLARAMEHRTRLGQ